MAGSRGYAIVIGVASVDPNYYGSTMHNATFKQDAHDMASFAKGKDFQLLGTLTEGEPEERPILNESATRGNIRATMEYAQRQLASSDILFVFFSGHGASLPRRGAALRRESPAERGDASRDERGEVWCLWDGHLWDDEWKDMLGEFRQGVRVLVITDTCFGGGFGPPDEIDPVVELGKNPTQCPRPRAIPRSFAQSIWDAEHSEFESIRIRLTRKQTEASVLLLSACQANQLACSGDRNGLFTARLLQVADLHPNLSYRELFGVVRRKFPPTQSPFYWSVGSARDAFGHEQAFSI